MLPTIFVIDAEALPQNPPRWEPLGTPMGIYAGILPDFPDRPVSPEAETVCEIQWVGMEERRVSLDAKRMDVHAHSTATRGAVKWHTMPGG